MADEKGSGAGVPAENEPKPEEEIVESTPSLEPGSENATEPTANDDTEASEPETPPQDGLADQPGEPEKEAAPATSESPEAPMQPTASKPKRRFHISKKVAIIGLCALIILGGGGALTYKKISTKKQPATLFSKTVVEPFKVVSSSPLPDQANVGADSRITVTFNRPVDPDEMKGDFFVSPQVDGKFSQGKTPEQIVFTPSVQFTKGTKFQFMIHGEFTAKDGSKLGADYFGKFTTAIPGNGFYFVRKNEFLDLDSMPTGTDAKYTISAGSDIKDGTTVTVYKSGVSQLLRSFIYADQTDDLGYTWPKLTGSTVSTDGLSVVSTKSDVRDGGSIDFHGNAGVYLAVATNDGKQVGRMWVVVSDYGMLLRQDDRNVVVALQKLDGSGSASGDVDFYSLDGGVNSLTSRLIDGQATVPLDFKPRLDIAVAHIGGQVQVVPVSEWNSLADIRSMNDLSTKPIAFGTTDKPSYKPGETVNFAGYLRTDNDAAYNAYARSTAQLYVAAYSGGPHLADITVPISSDGTFTGSFTVQDSFIVDGAKSQLHIYAAGDPEGAVGYGATDADVASFTATNEAAGQFALQVTFGKSDYLPTDKITANIVGVNADGSPLANTAVDIDTYAKQYTEGEIDQTTYLGNQIDKSPAQVQLDGQGKASFTVDVSKLPSGSSQAVTVVASKKESSGTNVAGSGQTIVHQGDAVLRFGPSRTVVKPNGTLVARIYAKTLVGASLVDATIDYKVESSSWNQNTQQYDTRQLTGGTVTTDGSGYATINQSLSNAPLGSITLTVSTGDEENNKVQAQQFYYVDDGKSNIVYSDVQLEGLDVYGPQTDVRVGDELHLTVDAPQAVHALMTLERGRVYNTQVLDLHAGKNSLTVPVTQELMPSFNLVFSYFAGGQYHVDGVPFEVAADTMHAAVSIKTPGSSVPANMPFTLPLTVSDSNGNGLDTHVIFSASESSMFDTASPLTSPIFAHLYAPRERTTNSSSSLTAIGSGGGKCGGGGNDLPDYILPSGAVATWQPDLATDIHGQASVPLNLPKGRWHLMAYVMSQDNVVGSASTDITAE